MQSENKLITFIILQICLLLQITFQKSDQNDCRGKI